MLASRASELSYLYFIKNYVIILNTIPTLYKYAGYIVSVHRMVMENRPVDPGSIQGSHRPISSVGYRSPFWDRRMSSVIRLFKGNNRNRNRELSGRLFGRLFHIIVFFFQAEDGIRDRSPSRGLGDVYKRQSSCWVLSGFGNHFPFLYWQREAGSARRPATRVFSWFVLRLLAC